jgi:hypothetical protein
LTKSFKSKKSVKCTQNVVKFQLSMALKDVKYMQMAGFEAEKIPPEALALYEKKDVFRKNLIHCDQVARWYNKINNSATPVEAVLLENKVGKLDKIIKQGENELKWSDHESKGFDSMSFPPVSSAPQSTPPHISHIKPHNTQRLALSEANRIPTFIDNHAFILCSISNSGVLAG